MPAVLRGDPRAFHARGVSIHAYYIVTRRGSSQQLYRVPGGEAGVLDAATASCFTGKVSQCGLFCINSPGI